MFKHLILFIFLLPSISYALTFKDLQGKRQHFDAKKIMFTGTIKDIKRITKKKSITVKLKLIDLYSKSKMDVTYIESLDGKMINNKFLCKNFEDVTFMGIFTSKKSKYLIGSILIDRRSPSVCSTPYKTDKILKQYTSETLSEQRKKNDLKVIKLKGFIKNFKRSHSAKKSEVKFKLVDSAKSKYSTKVILGLKYNDNIINTIDCSEGSFVVISGIYFPNKSMKSKDLGVLKAISKNHVECKGQKLELTEKQKLKQKKQMVKERHKELKILFKKYKRELKSKKTDYDIIKTSVESIINMCQKGGTQKLIKTCIKINVYLRTIDQRNQISFKIQNTIANLLDISILNTYKPKKENNIIELIKLFYPDKSSYVIGVPARCYDRELYNPSNPSYPYSSLKISKETKQHFTPILAMFNNPKLNCGSVLDSIYMIGNMDDDDKLDILRVDTSKKEFYKIISSDI